MRSSPDSSPASSRFSLLSSSRGPQRTYGKRSRAGLTGRSGRETVTKHEATSDEETGEEEGNEEHGLLREKGERGKDKRDGLLMRDVGPSRVEKRNGAPVKGDKTRREREVQADRSADAEEEREGLVPPPNRTPKSAAPQRRSPRRTLDRSSPLSPSSSRSISASPSPVRPRPPKRARGDPSFSGSDKRNPDLKRETSHGNRLHKPPGNQGPPRAASPPVVSIASSSTSVPSLRPPATPPPPDRKDRTLKLTPRSSPRDLSGLFAGVSPGKSRAGERDSDEDSPGKNGARPLLKAGARGLRGMLTRTESLGGSGSGSPAQLAQSSSLGDIGSRPRATTPTRSLGRTQSLPDTPSKTPGKDGSLMLGSPGGEGLLVPASFQVQEGRAGAGSGGQAKRTYGRTRTILAEASGEDVPSGSSTSRLNMDRFGSMDGSGLVKETYAEARKRFEVDHSGFEGGSGGGNLSAELISARAPQPVSDMRSKGENRRFMDEIAYLADSIHDPSTSLSLKRSSSLDILENMQDPAWLSRMEMCGQTERIWEAFYAARGDGDEAMDAICLLFLSICAESGSSLGAILLTHGEACIRLLLTQVKVRGGPLDEKTDVKPTGVTQRIRAIGRGCGVFSDDRLMTTRRFASHVLLDVCDEPQGPALERVFEAEKAAPRLMRALATELKPLLDRFEMHEKGLDLLPGQGDGTPLAPLDFQHVLQCLRVLLRRLTLSDADQVIVAEAHADFADDLVSCIVGMSSLALAKEFAAGAASGVTDEAQARVMAACTVEALQIMAVMANMSLAWATAVTIVGGSTSALLRIALGRDLLVAQLRGKPLAAGERGSSRVRDEDPTGGQRHRGGDRATDPEEILCLVLALLVEAMLSDPTAIEVVARTAISPRCSGQRACLRYCRCADSRSLGSHLVGLFRQYTAQLDEDEEKPMSGAIGGYLALLLAKIMCGVQGQRRAIMAELPGATDRERLETLLSYLGELHGLQSFAHRLGAGMTGMISSRRGDIRDEEDDEAHDESRPRRSSGQADMGGSDNIVQTAIAELRQLLEES